jgi:hypothetical protein
MVLPPKKVVQALVNGEESGIAVEVNKVGEE